MPEQYRALLAILGLATIVFAFAKKPATALAMSAEDFVRRRNCWIFITLAAFLSPNYWIFAGIAIFFILKSRKAEKNNVALFFFLLLALPQTSIEIPGLGPIRYLIEINYVQILTILLLVPLCFSARKKAKIEKTKYLQADKFLLAYVFINIVIPIEYFDAITVMRGVVTWTLNVIIPYYAISRTVRDLKSFRDVAMSFIIAAMLASIVGIFEFYKQWLPYSTLDGVWGVRSLAIYLRRADYLRAIATSGQAIIFGYVMAVAVGLYLYVRHSIPSKYLWLAGLLLLAGGEIAPLSKGPWVGVMAMVFVYLALSPARTSHFGKMLIVLPLVGAFLLTTDVGQHIMGFLPFVGTVDEGSAAYRQLVFEVSWQQVLENPFFGTLNFRSNLEELRQGQGIIDIVNSFMTIALRNGLVGLAIFISFFASILIGIYQAKQRVTDNPELLALGNVLIAILIGILVMIGTVSSISHVVIIYIIFAALGVAYCAFVNDLHLDTKLQNRTVLADLSS